MKRIGLLALTGIVFSFTSCDKEISAPQKVKDAFAEKFANATNMEWDKESDTEWEVEFKMNKKEFSSNFMQDGTWVETEYEVDVSEIPQLVMDNLKSNFEGYDIEEIEFSETVKGSLYEFGIEKGMSKLEVGIDARGVIVKKEEKNDDDENDAYDD